MKTVLERTDELLCELIYCDFRSDISVDKAKDLIRKALKEQDKITRHACAENELEFRVWDVQKKFHGKLDMLMILGPDHIEVDYEGHAKEPRRVRPEEAIVEQKINGKWIPVSFKSV